MSENRHGFHQQSRSTIDNHQATHRLHLLQSFQAEVAPLGTVRERGELHVAEHLSAGVIAWLAQFRHIPVAAGAEVVGPDDLLLSGYPVGGHQARNLVLDAQALATVGVPPRTATPSICCAPRRRASSRSRRRWATPMRPHSVPCCGESRRARTSGHRTRPPTLTRPGQRRPVYPRRPAPHGTLTPPGRPSTSPKATASASHPAARPGKSAPATSSSARRPANGTGAAPHPATS